MWWSAGKIFKKNPDPPFRKYVYAILKYKKGNAVT
jgi:hypothetical protein